MALATRTSPAQPGDSALARRLAGALEGEVLFDAFSRGRYSTDASIYQIEPVGVVVPKNEADLARAIEIAASQSVPILPRGGGTSQCGQTVGAALVLDCSKHLAKIVDFDADARRITVQPGIVLDDLNRFLKPHGLVFPIDVSTASRATIGGMTANNSCGSRSIRYGNMVHNVHAIDAILASGDQLRFADVPGNLGAFGAEPKYRELVQMLRGIAARESQEIDRRIPKLLRRVGGYNIDMIDAAGHNMAHILVGSEGTLATFRQIELALQPILPHRTLGVCHFPSFRAAMEAPQHIVKLGPAAVELVDRTMIQLGRDIDLFRPVVDRFVVGDPAALLLVEFAGEDVEATNAGLRQLVALMGDLGHPGAVVEATDPAFQAEIWEVRKQGLNIMMSMKGDGKPVSFIEDCAVALEDLADYTERLSDVFRRHGTDGTWYAHASVGCLHVRPILNMKDPDGARTMRAIAEEAFALVREYKGSHSGEHGDGLVRSEFHRPMFGDRIADAFAEIKDAFDPDGLMNPGKIVGPPKMDDRSLFRFKPGYKAVDLDTVLDWSDWGGFAGAVEMCNNNGACRKSAAEVMCPSYRVTRDEKHLTRGRANSLRLALSGQLGAGALNSPEMAEALDLCVSCKGCRRECPTGVDMAKMKIEVLHQRRQRHGLSLKDRLIAHLPLYAEAASRFHFIANLRDRIPGLARLSEWALGLSAQRSLPVWHSEPFRGAEAAETMTGREVLLLADTFNTYFEPENLRAALAVLQAAGYRAHVVDPREIGERHLCCGRTYLAAGMVAEARAEAERMIQALRPYVEAGVAIIGLEPACLFTLKDEFKSMLPGPETDALAEQAMLFESFLVREHAAGRLALDFAAHPAAKALVHGHCHQKAFAAMGDVEQALRLVPGLEVAVIQSSCCGMAGAFGYEAAHYDVSMKMAELNLLPAVRAAGPDTVLVADGTSCRHQIKDGTDRGAVHVARVLAQALA